MADPIIATTTQSPPLVGVAQGAPVGSPGNPSSPLTGGQEGTFAGAGNTDIGNRTPGATLSNNQLQQLYVSPNSAAINNNIAAGQGLGSPLQGLSGLTAAPATMGAAGINTATSNPIMQAQLQQINQLNAQAQGQGPSPATVAAQQAAQQNVQNEMAMIASQRGGGANTALGLRNAQNAMAQANQQGVQAATLGKTQEELQAQQQLTGALGGAQGQAQQGAQAQASIQAQTNATNVQQQNQVAMQQLQAQLQAGQINIQQYNAMLQAQMTQANNQLAANMNYGGQMVGENTQLQGIAAGLTIANNQQNTQLLGAGIGAGGAVLAGGLQAASDINLKTNIKDGNRSVKDFLSKIGKAPSKFAAMSESI